jgi:hypothetical protein
MSSTSQAPTTVTTVLESLSSLDRAELEAPDGGINRARVRDAVAGRLASLPFEADCPDELDLRFRGGVAVRAEAGRAHANNEGVWATLVAALHPGIEALVLVVPELYKGAKAADPIEARLRRVLKSGGVMLDLAGVAVVRY